LPPARRLGDAQKLDQDQRLILVKLPATNVLGERGDGPGRLVQVDERDLGADARPASGSVSSWVRGQ
jgi:hypothetical protein